MPTPLKQGLQIFIETFSKNLYHADYARVCKIARDYTAYVTGEGIAEKLKRFVGRESVEMFNQRVELTEVITPDITNSTMNPMFKVGRTPATKIMRWKDDKQTQENRKKLIEAGEKYSGEQSVEDYLTYRLPELDSSDPNSFIVTEFEGEYDSRNPDKKIQPYPFEVNSFEAINYKYLNGDLQWLVVLNCEEQKKYTIYLSNESVVAREITKEQFKTWLRQNIDAILLDSVMNTDGDILLNTKANYYYIAGDKDKKNDRYFIVNYYEHKAGFVPAKRVGSKRDLITRGRTCVPIIHPAKAYLEKSIKTMSEFDLTNCLHTFPQKIQYTEACLGQKLKKGHIGCNNGATPTGEICGACNGSGDKVHTSAQDIIKMRLPKDLKDMVSLENVLVYKYPPIDLLKFQQELAFDKLKRSAQSAVYNSDVYSPEQIAVTATEKSIDLEAVYDTLMPFAKNWSEMWVHIYKTIAVFTNLGNEIELAHKFPNDFKMKPFNELLNDLKTANENQAPSHIKKAITSDITRKLYIDNPTEIVKIETKDRYFPFPGKSDSQIQYILANDMTTKFNKIFYAHFDLIFSDIEYDTSLKTPPVNFYMMEEKMQRDIIKAKVDEYVKALDDEDFASAQPPKIEDTITE